MFMFTYSTALHLMRLIGVSMNADVLGWQCAIFDCRLSIWAEWQCENRSQVDRLHLLRISSHCSLLTCGRNSSDAKRHDALSARRVFLLARAQLQSTTGQER